VHGLAFASRRGRGASPKLLAARLSSPRGSIAGMNSGQFNAIANVIISIALIALTVIAIPIALQLRRSYNKFNKLLDRLNEDAAPLIRHATAAAENVEYITTTIRSDGAADQRHAEATPTSASSTRCGSRRIGSTSSAHS
jgi:predicted PurR-regulated permease PerM